MLLAVHAVRLLLASHSAAPPGERGGSARSTAGLLRTVPLLLLLHVRGRERLPMPWHRLAVMLLLVLLVVMRQLGRHLHGLVALLLLLMMMKRPSKGMQALAGVGRCRRDGAMGGGWVGRLGLRLRVRLQHCVPRGTMAGCRGGAVRAVSLGPDPPAVQEAGGRGREHEGRGRSGGRGMADKGTSSCASMHLRGQLLLLLLGHWRCGCRMHGSVRV